ncbi:GNAT family N-acetyltransferase [Acetobacter papayae]|uniref:GNAT family N-acetyltransferase n=1 Tax=Acetobacter papayae TaxID=1076592 RepID=UPI0039E9D1E9
MDLRSVRTPRLWLYPVTWQDMDHMAALKADGAAFGQMLGGVRTRQQAEQDMAEDIAFWARYRVGIFTIRENGRFVGMTGLHLRPDGRGFGLRFALHPWARGRGIAREAANAALNFAHDAGIHRVVAVAAESNVASRTILGSIGMHVVETFARNGQTMVLYESQRA